MGFTVGKCKFEGTPPKQSTSHGRVVVYHNGTVRITGTSGSKSVWSGSGDIFVIFRSGGEIGKHEFKVTGKVQICNDF